jgi:hypothetical protein
MVVGILVGMVVGVLVGMVVGPEIDEAFGWKVVQ